MKNYLLRFLAAALCGLSVPAFGQGTAFNYQGQLDINGASANASYDLTFALFTTSNGTTQVGGTLTNLDVGVTNGLFITTLDFGQGIFTGAPLWLEIGVRSNGSAGAFTSLSPLQEVAADPYAVLAGGASNLLGTVSDASLSGTYSNAITLNNSGNFLTGNGAGVANVNAVKLGGLPSTGFWQTSGNSSTPASTNYLGTTDNNPFELHVNGGRALRLEPGSSPNVIGGYSGNFVTSGALGATIGGGGSSSATNRVTAFAGTVGGGVNNVVSNTNGGVSGGANNVAGGVASSVGGGSGNTAGENYSRIGGGQGNGVQAGAQNAAIAGGEANTIQAGGVAAVIGGGNSNTNNGVAGTIAGGQSNVVAGGYSQPAVGGGSANIASNSYAAISGGLQNTNLGEAGTIGGGQQNLAGNFNQPTVSGGYNNQAINSYATVPGGYQNLASGEYSFAAGQQARAVNEGSFVWADSQASSFSSSGSNQFLIRALGGVGVNTSSPLNGAALDVEGSAVGGFGSPAAFIQNNSAAANASPALRMIGHGNTANGILSVSTAGTGLLAQFGNASGFVAQLDTNGNWTANSFSGVGSNLTSVNATTLAGGDLTAVNGTSLSVGTNIYLNNNPIYLHTDKNNGLAYCGNGVTNFPNASVQPDGPVLWGNTGGALGVLNGGAEAILNWSNSGVSVSGTFTASNLSGNGIISWEASGSSVQAVPNTGYLMTSGSQATVTLPASPNATDIVRVSGGGTGGWRIAQNAGQSVMGNFLAGTNFQTNWTSAGSATAQAGWRAVASSADGTHLVAVGSDISPNSSIFTSVNSGGTWVTNNNAPPNNWSAVASSWNGTNLAATGTGASGYGSPGLIYTSANAGATWAASGAPSEIWGCIASSFDGTHLAAGVDGPGVIYTSANSGGTWTPSATSGSLYWSAIASSENGSNLVATDISLGYIYISTNAGGNWTKLTSGPVEGWTAVACSADGTKILAADGDSAGPGLLWVSQNSGASWSSGDSTPNTWSSVASSANGVNLVAVVGTPADFEGQIYYSTNSGGHWIAAGPTEHWSGVASSIDGTKLVAVASAGAIPIYLCQDTAQTATTTGTAGALSGAQATATELQYIGNNQFMQLSHSGTIFAH